MARVLLWDGTIYNEEYKSTSLVGFTDFGEFSLRLDIYIEVIFDHPGQEDK